MGFLDNKVAIVTGSDSGIGRGIAIEFAKQGATVVVNYVHNQQKAQEVLQTIEKNNGKVLVLQADVSQVQQAQGLIQQTVEHFNRLDIIVNNAGMEIHSPFVDVTEEQFDRVLSVDLKGVFFCAQAAAREMIKRKIQGRIINISSVHEDLAMPKNAPYCCAKGGVRMLMRTSRWNSLPITSPSTISRRVRFTPLSMPMLRLTPKRWPRCSKRFRCIAWASRTRSPNSPSTWHPMLPPMSPAQPTSSTAA